MRLIDYKDSNGSSLQTFVDLLMEKLAAHTNLTGFLVICDLEKARKGENEGIHLVSMLGEGGMITRVPEILKILARQMERQSFTYEGSQRLHEGDEK